MADNVFEYDTTAGNNTLSGSQSLAENVMKVPAINDVMRTSYAHFAAYLEDMAGKNTVGGTADAITLTTSMGFADPLVDGLTTAFQAASAVTGASTINVDATGAIALRRNGDTATESGDIIEDGIYLIRYDASANSSAGAWILLNREPNASVYDPNIALLALEVADLKGDRLGMSSGIADPFDDETDVDTATSTNESYDSTDDLYSPTAAYTGTATTASITTTGDHTPGNITYRQHFDASVVSNSGSFVRVEFEGPSSGTPQEWQNVFIGHAASSGDAYDFDGNQVRLTFSGANTLVPPTGSTVYSDWVAITIDNTKDLIVAMDSTDSNAARRATSGLTSAYNLYYKVSVVDASTTNTSGYSVAASNGGGGIKTVQVATAYTIDNMSLVSNAFTADSEPNTARLALQVIENESVTANTDITGEVSRDGGTSWTTATLTLTATNGSVLLYEDAGIDISGQSSGTSMKWRAKTLNNKDIDISGVVLQWS